MKPGENLTAENLVRQHYLDAIEQLQQALAQHDSIERREFQDQCAICGDGGHTAEQCWYHNPLLLASLGFEALLGNCWRCFHCGAVFTDETSAEGHFGKTLDEAAECVRQLAALDI